MRRVYSFLATVCGIGHLPVMPGTWGSLAALPLAVFLHEKIIISLIVFAALFIIGVISSEKTEKDYGIKDPSFIVIDEFAGVFLIFLGVPVKPFILIMGFVLYRLMDIVKVQPARSLEKLKGGWGIMLDDLVCGIYTNLILRCLILLHLLK